MELKELLALPYLKGATVVAGHKGMSRPVKSVNIMDAPDIAQFVKANELLLTNAYAIKDTPSEFIRIIEQMVHKQSSGLFIKTKRFLYEIPQDVIDLANELDFPIVELTMQYSLGEVLNHTIEFILEKQTEQLRYALDMHKQFSDMMIKGRGLPQLIETLASILNCYTVLSDELNNIVASASPGNGRQAEQIPLDVALRRLSSLRESSAAGLPIGNLCLWDTELPNSLEVSFYPIETFSRQSCLTLIRAAQPPQANKPFNQLVIEQAINIIEFEWIKRHAVKERSRRFKNEFFSDLMEGSIHSEDDIYNKGRKYNIIRDEPYCCIIAKADPSEHSFPGKSSKSASISKDIIYDRLKQQLLNHHLSFALFTKNDYYGILLHISRDMPPSAVVEKLIVVQQAMFARYHLPMSFGIGTASDSMITIHLSYEEAVEALRSGYRQQKNMFIESYKAKETEDLLRLVPSDILKEYCSMTFKEVLDLEAKERQEMQRTIQVFLENQCSISETAKKLFVHRNTVIYRIRKYERLSQRSLLDPSDTLRIRLALLIDNVLNTARS